MDNPIKTNNKFLNYLFHLKDKYTIEDVKYLFKMIFDKHYKKDIKTYLLFFGALAYVFIVPDLIPDIIPIFGLIDDITIILFAFSLLKKEIDKYKLEKGK